MRDDLTQRLGAVESAVGTDDDTLTTDSPPVREIEINDPAPDRRPDGMAYDPSTGVLSYDFWDPQHEFLDALENEDTQIVAFLAGYGSGKSIGGARWLIIQALRYPGSRFLAMGQSFSEARHATYQVLFDQLPGERTSTITSSYNGPETSPIVTDYNRAEHRLTLFNDSQIILGSADKWSRHAGSEFGAIWLDEPSHYGEDLHDLLEMMGSRLRGVPGPKVQAWTLTGNGYNAAWEILEKQQDSDGEDLSLNIDVIRASTLDNPYLSDGEKEQFRLQYAGTSREEQALFGGFAAAQGLVYSQFSREQHVIPHHDARDRVEPGWRIYGYDHGFRDPRVILEIGKTPYDQLVVLDEFHDRETHVEDAIEWLKRNNKPQGTIYCEHEPEHIQKFEEAGWPAKKAAKDFDGGVDEVRKRLTPEGNIAVDRSANSQGSRGTGWGTGTGTVTVNRSGEKNDATDCQEKEGRVGLLISDRCEHTIRELLGYKEEDAKTSRATDHCCDSLRYAVFSSGSGATKTRQRLPLTPGSAR